MNKKNIFLIILFSGVLFFSILLNVIFFFTNMLLKDENTILINKKNYELELKNEHIQEFQLFLLNDKEKIKLQNNFNNYLEYCFYFYDIISKVLNDNIYITSIERINEIGFDKTSLLFNVRMNVNGRNINFKVHGDLLPDKNNRFIEFYKH